MNFATHSLFQWFYYPSILLQKHVVNHVKVRGTSASSHSSLCQGAEVLAFIVKLMLATNTDDFFGLNILVRLP